MKTILEALAQTAARPGNRGFHTLKNGKIVSSLSYARLQQRAEERASELRYTLQPGERVGLVFFNEIDFIELFFSILMVGAIPVPIAPPQPFSPLNGFYKRVGLIARQSSIKHFFISTSISEDVRETLGIHTAACVHTISELPSHNNRDDSSTTYTPCEPGKIALIQYTSGSTSDPKGVVVSHQNLILNVSAMRESFKMDPTYSGVTWLPFFHDMGLIGGLLLPILVGSDSYIMRTADFIKSPLSWLKAISDFGLKISPAPNFAYQYCLDRLDPEASLELDLGSWRSATSGAEPINPAVMRRFSETFEPYGFNPAAIMPLYGMAEATLGATFSPAGQGMRSLFVDRDALRRGIISLVRDGKPGAKEIVSCGVPIRHVQVAISLQGSSPMDFPLLLGEIALKGESVCSAYDNDPLNTAKMLDDGWFMTGDVGFLYEHNLYVVGRNKEVIIIHGSNYFANDIESCCAEVPEVRGAAAIALTDSDEEGCALLLVPAKGVDQARLATTLQRKISGELGIRILDIRIIQPSQLLKTTSGKIDRAKMKRFYTDTFLQPLESIPS